MYTVVTATKRTPRTDHIVELSKLKYAKFTIKALLKYWLVPFVYISIIIYVVLSTTNERGHVISTLYGKVRKLIRHSEASEIVEIAYNDWANASQRDNLLSEFYGPIVALYKDQPLGTLLSHDSDHRPAIMKHFKESLLPLCEK